MSEETEEWTPRPITPPEVSESSEAPAQEYPTEAELEAEELAALEKYKDRTRKQLDWVKHQLDADRLNFEKLQWQVDKALEEAKIRYERSLMRQQRLQQSANEAYFHNHNILGMSLHLYLGSLSDRRHKPGGIDDVLDEFRQTWRAVRELVVQPGEPHMSLDEPTVEDPARD